MESLRDKGSEAIADGTFRLGLATASQLLLHGGFTEELASAIRRDGGVERALAALRREFFPTRLSVPSSITAFELITRLECKLRTSRIEVSIVINPKGDKIHNVQLLAKLLEKDLELVKGKTFDVLGGSFSYFPASGISYARQYQNDRAYDANLAAMITWLLGERPKGKILSVPNDEHRFSDCVHQGRVVSFHMRKREGIFEIGLCGACYQPEVKTRFVAFREIPG